MKRLAFALTLFALPLGAHADEAQDLSRFDALNYNARAFGVCEGLGFQINQQGIVAAIEAQGRALVADGYTEGTLAYMAEKQVSLGRMEDPMAKLPDVTGDPEAVKSAILDFEARFALAEDHCFKLIGDPYLGYFIKAIGYQATSESKSFFGMFLYEAERGDADKMFLVATYYDYEVKRDPDHTQAFNWYSKAANAGNWTAASVLAGSYFTGYGTPKDIIEAIKWAAIANARGDDAESLATIEGAATIKQRQEGRRRAVTWLKTQ